MSTSTDRWSCPVCNTTVVIDGSPADVHAAIDAAQRRHAAEHRKAAQVLAQMRQAARDAN